MVKNPPASAGDVRDASSIPGSERSPGGGHGNPLQYSCLENPHGQRKLGAYNPWGCKESDTTEVTKQYIYIYIYIVVSQHLWEPSWIPKSMEDQVPSVK